LWRRAGRDCKNWRPETAIRGDAPERVLRAFEDERQLRVDEMAERAIARVKHELADISALSYGERKNQRMEDSQTSRGHAVDHLRAQPI